MNQVKYSNRYNQVHTFTKTEDGNILWEGDFEWCRYGWPNVYDDAYAAYCEDTESELRISLEQFREAVHEPIYDQNDKFVSMSTISQMYAPLVYSDKNKINVLDPTGGPYLHSGQDMGLFDESFKGMKIEKFEKTDNSNVWKIIIKK